MLLFLAADACYGVTYFIDERHIVAYFWLLIEVFVPKWSVRLYVKVK